MKRMIVSCATLLITMAPAVHAHTQLSESLPADKSVLESAPEEIVLIFSEGVRLTALSIQGSGGGAKRDLGPLPVETTQRFSIAAPPLAAGDYLVTWRVLSQDTHVMTGEIAFTVKQTVSASR